MKATDARTPGADSQAALQSGALREEISGRFREQPPGEQTSRGLIEATLLRTRDGVARGTGLKITPNKHAAKNQKH
jgi:hypothetical protein